MKENGNGLKNLILITEVGLAVILPAGLMLALGLWLRNRFGLTWPLIPLILLGLAGGLLSAWRLLKRFAPDPKKDTPRESYDLMQEWHREDDEE